MSYDAVDQFQKLCREDLKAALRARRGEEVSVLRALLTAVDNAQSVTIGQEQEKYTVRQFGDPGNEVPRRPLSLEEISEILARELSLRQDAITEFVRLKMPDHVAQAELEIRILRRYL